MRTEASLPSGKTISMQVASLSNVMALKRAVASAFKAVNLQLSDPLVAVLFMATGGDTEEAREQAAAKKKSLLMTSLADKDLNFAKNAALSLLDSQELDSLLMACMATCNIDGVRLTEKYFEDESARDDYMVAAWEVMRLNLRPFIVGLGFAFTSAIGSKDQSGSPK